MAEYFHPDNDFLRKLGAVPPTTTSHMTEDEIKKNMKQLMPYSWVLKGNQLIGQTESGPLVQNIDPNYILTGTDNDGMPVFKKVLI